MSGRKIFAILTLLFVSSGTALFAAAPWAYSVGFSGLDLSWEGENEDILIQEQVLGLDFRGSAILPRSGFYYGSFINFSLPLMRVVDDPLAEETVVGDSEYDFYTAFGIPFGYRWNIASGRMGVYLGAGPAMQLMIDFDHHVWGSGGMALEIGIETLKGKGVGISVGSRFLMSFGAFTVAGQDVVDAAIPLSTMFHIGISWTGERN